MIVLALSLHSAAANAQTLVSQLEAARGALPPGTALRLAGTATAFAAKSTFVVTIGDGGQYTLNVDGPLPHARGFDGTSDWETDFNGVSRQTQLGDREVNRLRDWLSFGGWLDTSHSLVPLANVPADNATAPASLALQMPDGTSVATVWVDSDNRVTRFKFKGMNGAETTTLSNYTKEHGVWIPRTVRTETEHGDVIELEIEQFELVTDADFAQPKTPLLTIAGNPNLELKLATTGHILVRVSIDDLAPGWFILDTGAGATGLDARRLAETNAPELGNFTVASLMGYIRSPLRRVDRINVGPATLESHVVFEMDFSPFDQVFGERIDGIIGYDLFSRCVARISVSEPSVTLQSSQELAGDNDSDWRTLSMNSRIPLIYGQVDGQDGGRYRMDIGAAGGPFGNVIIHEPFARTLPGYDDNDAEVVAMPPHEFRMHTIERFTFGGKSFSSVDVALATKDLSPFNDPHTQGNIGAALLASFVLVLDYPNQRYQLLIR